VSVARITTLFALAFGGTPEVVASAPGRVNLIGEHTDHNGGDVLPIAIGRRTWVAMRPGRTRRTRIVSAESGEAGEIDAVGAEPDGKWWDYVAGALRESGSLGSREQPLDVAVASDVPMGAGLSSSAALEVSTVVASLALDGRAADPGDVARAAHRAETGYVGVACGIMDQFASALCRSGQALHLQCETEQYAQVAFPHGVLIVDTATPRALRASAYNTRQRECREALSTLRTIEPSLGTLASTSLELLKRAQLRSPLDRRARHVVTENARVHEAVAALASGQSIGPLLNASHASLRDDYECSSPELDWVVGRACEAEGVEGARLTGAGWGGCAIAIGHAAALQGLARDIVPAFSERWGRAARVWVSEASDGARIESS
jgi:galactokinase